MSWIVRLRRRLIGIAPEEIAFADFHIANDAIRFQMSRVAESFRDGYHHALEGLEGEVLVRRLDEVPGPLRGFAFEGAGLGLAVVDLLSFWRRGAFRRFVTGAGAPHAYMMHVGAGLALGRVPYPPAALLSRLDPVLRWAAVDGYGFYEGFKRRALRVEAQAVPARLRGYARRAFDVGLGRSLWFSEGAEVDRLVARVASFTPERRADLWSGVGIASSYTGWVDLGTIEALARAAAEHQAELAQGAAVSAWARQRAGNPTPETDAACCVLCGVAPAEAAAIAAEALESLPPDKAEPAFEVWRRRVRDRLGASPAPVAGTA